MADPRELLLTAYGDFNAHNLDAILPVPYPGVVWQDGIDGSVVRGAD